MWGQLGNGAASQYSMTPVAVFGLSGVTAIVASSTHTCALLAGGTVECWGDHTLGGDTTPVAVAGLSGATAISAFGTQNCAVISGGSVTCWTEPSYGSVSVAGLSGATAVAVGSSHSCALLLGGAVKCWGYNGDGQLGDGTTTDSPTPVTVSGLTGATAITAGLWWSCAKMSGGTVKCWGYNGDGQLGDGTTTNKLTPVSVSGLTGATAIAAGEWATCAIVAGGTVKCWGNNMYGQIGDGTTTERDTPVSVSGLSGATAIAFGETHTCAVVASGAVKCWGGNEYGQLGDGTTTTSLTPVTVAGLTGATRVAGGGDGVWGAHTCALITGGTVKCWGWNGEGALGDGFPTGSSTPVAVRSFANTVAVSGIVSPCVAGAAHSFTVTAKDAYAGTATSYRGTIHLTSTDAKAVLPADYTFTAADAGVHTFSVTLKTPGTQAVRARDTVTSTITGIQTGIVVNPGAARTLAVSGITSPYVAGAAHSVTVTAKDVCGNTVTGYTGTVHFTSTDAQAILPANYTFKASDKGVQTFSVTLKTAGSQSVRARDTVTSTITGGQYPIVVTPAVATTFVASGLSSPRTAGVAGNLTVTARDAYGNTATGYSGTVHFTSTDTKAILPANYTFKASDKGVHTFSVTLKTAGTQAIRARDTVTSTITGLQSGIVVG